MEKSGIPTTYHGYKFRSRLEAMWACFFDEMDWKWKYEPFDYNGYIPDFVLLLPKSPLLVEIKPELTVKDLRPYIEKIDRSPWKKEALILGVGILDRGRLGLLGDLDVCGNSRTWGAANIHRDRGHIGLCSEDGSWACRYTDQCDHHDHNFDYAWFESQWAHAQNMVQWAPKMFGITSPVDR